MHDGFTSESDDSTEESKILTRLRLNNIQWNWKQGEEELCKASNLDKGGLVHMMTECSATKEKHWKDTSEIKNRIENLLVDKTEENMKHLKEIYKMWERQV